MVKHSASAKRDRTPTLIEQGFSALERNCVDDAHRIASDLLARGAADRGALHLLGMSLLMQKRTREAIEPLQQAARGQSNPEIEMQLGAALRQLGRQAEAQIWLERAVSRAPPLPEAFLELSLLFSTQRRFADAEAVLKRGLDIAPTFADLSIELGGVYINKADPGYAKLAFARALAHAPRHPRALHGFGIALLYEGAFERAADRFRQVLAQDPHHARARMDLAHCLLELGRIDEAMTCLREMVQCSPHLYGRALRIVVSSGRGRFWLRRSDAAAFLNPTAPAVVSNAP